MKTTSRTETTNTRRQDMKVIVAGSRNFQDYKYLAESLDSYLEDRLPNVEIVSGTAAGADRMGERYAEERKLKCKKMPADWANEGRAAGYRRNERMAKYADAAIIFWDGESKGSKHMIDTATKENLIVRIDYYMGKPDDGDNGEPMTRLGPAITEICKWDRKLEKKVFELKDLPWESFRARVKSMPQVSDNPVNLTNAYTRNAIVDGIWLKNSVELVHKRAKISRNTDLPDTLPLDEMGVPGPSNRENYMWPEIDPNAPAYRKSRHLDNDSIYFKSQNGKCLLNRTVGGMNDRDFRDRCVQANGKLYVLYQQGSPELAPQNHLQAETFVKWAAQPCKCKRNCDHLQTEMPESDADSIVKALERLNMDRKSTTRLMFGYHAFERDSYVKTESGYRNTYKSEWRDGVKSMDAEELMDFAKYLEDLEAGMPKLAKVGENEERTLDDERIYYSDVSQRLIETRADRNNIMGLDIEKPQQQLLYIDQLANSTIDNASTEQPDPSEIDTLISRGFDYDLDELPVGLNRYEVWQKDIEQVGEIMVDSENQAYEDTDFRSSGDGWTAFPLHFGEDTVKWHWCQCVRHAGVKRLQAWKRIMRKLYWLTYPQRSDLWARIWERQEQLIAIIKTKSEKLAQVRTIIEEMGSLSQAQARALVYAYQVGGSFERYNSFDFEEPGDPELAFYLWDKYKQDFKGKKPKKPETPKRKAVAIPMKPRTSNNITPEGEDLSQYYNKTADNISF